MIFNLIIIKYPMLIRKNLKKEEESLRLELKEKSKNVEEAEKNSSD